MTTIKFKFRASTIVGRHGVLYVQLIHERDVKLITTKIKLHNFEWDSSTQHVVCNNTDVARSAELALIQSEVEAETTKLRQIIDRLEASDDYTAADVANSYLKRPSGNMLTAFILKRIKELETTGNIRTAETYSSTLRAFLAFRQGRDIPLGQIDECVLCDFEHHTLARNVTRNTSSFYIRILRTVYRGAVTRGIIEDKRPFKAVYTGIDSTTKHAIDNSVIDKLRQIKELPHGLCFARDMFLFSFYTHGMSFVDTFYLKKENLTDDILEYTQTRTGQQLRIKIEEHVRKIIDLYCDDTQTSIYLFPFIKDNNITLNRQYSSALRLQNKRLKIISTILRLNQPLTSHTARHTWANIAHMSGMPVHIISQSLGHRSEQTTLLYLASLDQNITANTTTTVVCEP